jgi:hypothetical protein
VQAHDRARRPGIGLGQQRPVRRISRVLKRYSRWSTLRSTGMALFRQSPAIVLVCCLAGVTGNASATTAPGGLFSLPVTISDSRLVIHPNAANRQYGHLIQRNGTVATFPRGTLVRFVFTNRGTKTYLPAIKLIHGNIDPYLHLGTSYTFAQHAIPPGGHVELIANFYYRGSFLLQALLHKRPHGNSAHISVT